MEFCGLYLRSSRYYRELFFEVVEWLDVFCGCCLPLWFSFGRVFFLAGVGDFKGEPKVKPLHLGSEQITAVFRRFELFDKGCTPNANHQLPPTPNTHVFQGIFGKHLLF